MQQIFCEKCKCFFCASIKLKGRHQYCRWRLPLKWRFKYTKHYCRKEDDAERTRTSMPDTMMHFKSSDSFLRRTYLVRLLSRCSGDERLPNYFCFLLLQLVLSFFVRSGFIGSYHFLVLYSGSRMCLNLNLFRINQTCMYTVYF